MIKTLLKLAEILDRKGLYSESDIIDNIIYKIATKNELVRALKNNDVQSAAKALPGMSGDDLGLTHKEFGELVWYIQEAAMGHDEEDPTSNRTKMDKARDILGVGKNDIMSLNPYTHNPITGKPWPTQKTYEDLNQRPKINDKVKIKESGEFGVITNIFPDPGQTPEDREFDEYEITLDGSDGQTKRKYFNDEIIPVNV